MSDDEFEKELKEIGLSDEEGDDGCISGMDMDEEDILLELEQMIDG